MDGEEIIVAPTDYTLLPKQEQIDMFQQKINYCNTFDNIYPTLHGNTKKTLLDSPYWAQIKQFWPPLAANVCSYCPVVAAGDEFGHTSREACAARGCPGMAMCHNAPENDAFQGAIYNLGRVIRALTFFHDGPGPGMETFASDEERVKRCSNCTQFTACQLVSSPAQKASYCLEELKIIIDGGRAYCQEQINNLEALS